jgi:ABC-2 type transport system permease protein
MQNIQRRRPAILIQLADLFLIQLSNWRWSWRSTIIVGTAAPLGSIIALGVFARGAGPEALAYVLTGNIVLSLMFENLDKVCSNFSYMREVGTLSYFATLPIQRYMLVLATVLAFLTLSLPSLLVTLCLGSMILGVSLAPHPVILLVIPLAAIPLSGIGALIGTSARNPQEASSVSLLTTLVLPGLGPVIVPPGRLPAFILAVGRFSPATYAASALRQVLLGPLTPRLWLDLAVLVGLSVVIFWLASLMMDWRQQ